MDLFGELAHPPHFLLKSYKPQPFERAMEIFLEATDSPQHLIKTKNLSYILSNASNTTRNYILKNVNCEAKPGKITAIAGPSGAGKTTLLEIMAGAIVPRHYSGHVLVNDQPMNVANFRRISGYVTQDEALFPLLTVEETLMYSARLRVKEGIENAKCRVMELLRELNLEHISKMRIGGETNRGISGGEKRRVSIGVELVHDPSVLLLDEPTSGLDSSSALVVVSMLKNLSKNQGKTLVLTIHQPGFRIIQLFDEIVLLSNGVLLHQGSLSLLEERLKFSGHCIPLNVNVLEFAIDVIQTLSIDIVTETEEEDKLISLREKEKNHIFYPNSHFSEIIILSQRFSRNIFRTKQLFVARLAQALLVGLLLGTIFMNAMSDPKKAKVQTRIGFFAFTLTFLLNSTSEALPIFLEERRIMMRETSRGVYRISSYVISNTLVFMPFLLLVALLYATPIYWLVGLRNDIEGFLYFALVAWIIVLMSNSFVACLSALVPNFIAGSSIVSGVMGAFFLFSGYFIVKGDIPKYWIFMNYLSLFKYPFECLLINEYGGDKGRTKCLESVGGLCLLDGNGFLIDQGLKESQKWSNLIVMLFFVFIYRFLCFLVLSYRSYKSRS